MPQGHQEEKACLQRQCFLKPKTTDIFGSQKEGNTDNSWKRRGHVALAACQGKNYSNLA